MFTSGIGCNKVGAFECNYLEFRSEMVWYGMLGNTHQITSYGRVRAAIQTKSDGNQEIVICKLTTTR